jgi:anti-anti-sigma factor
MHLGGVQLIDSAGLELLLDVRDRCLRSGGALQLAAPNPLCRDILQATGLASQFAIFDTVTAAVGSFAQ